jgi:hypothetical protein
MVLSIGLGGAFALTQCGSASFPARLLNVKLCKAHAALAVVFGDEREAEPSDGGPHEACFIPLADIIKV